MQLLCKKLSFYAQKQSRKKLPPVITGTTGDIQRIRNRITHAFSGQELRHNAINDGAPDGGVRDAGDGDEDAAVGGGGADALSSQDDAYASGGLCDGGNAGARAADRACTQVPAGSCARQQEAAHSPQTH